MSEHIRRRLTFRVDDRELTVTAYRHGDDLVIERDGVVHRVRLLSDETIAPSRSRAPRPAVSQTPAAPAPSAAPAPPPAGPPAASGGNTILSPMVGVVKSVEVQPGDKVRAGDRVVILEAMKMDIDVVTDVDGTVESVLVSAGTNVTERQGLVALAGSD